MATLPAPAPWRRVKWTRAGQVASLTDVGAMLAPFAEASPPAAFAALRAGLPFVAVSFVAQCLPKLDAVRWMAECLARVPPPASGTAGAETRTGMMQWLADPSDKRRRLVFAAAEAAGFETPEGAAGVAVFLSGGSLAPAELEQGAQPIPGAFGRAVAGAVMVAAAAQGGQAFAGELDVMLGLAERIASTEAAG